MRENSFWQDHTNMHSIDCEIVEIPTVNVFGCCVKEYDSTYPIHLQGIIEQEEFQKSIDNINKAFSTRKSNCILGISTLVVFCIGVIFVIIAGIHAGLSQSYDIFGPLAAVGFGLMFIAFLIVVIGYCIAELRSNARMRQAIAEESRKYSSRRPIPCSWRLNSRTTHQLPIIIEIGRNSNAQDRNTPRRLPRLNSLLPNAPLRSDDISLPPPYDSQTSRKFCFQCEQSLKA